MRVFGAWHKAATSGFENIVLFFSSKLDVQEWKYCYYTYVFNAARSEAIAEPVMDLWIYGLMDVLRVYNSELGC